MFSLMIVRVSSLSAVIFCASFALTGVPAGRGATPRKLDFNRDVRPILSDGCFACHGFDAKKRKADLRLDVPEGAFAVIDGVQAIKPGDPAGSEALKRILSADPDEIMPPPDSHKKLTPRQIETLRQWIAEGAVYKKHWSFEPPTKPSVPAVLRQEAGIRNEVDAFLIDRLQDEGLSFSLEAPREQLIRRVTLDLTGLPPTLAEVDAFLADASPDAYENVVDRLLESARYGEHMARYWLDAARYGDTHGLHLDNERSLWPYRDWVVSAFNRNLPFDQFTIWQLAGDLLPNPTQEQIAATGFNRCNVTTSEGGSIDEEFIFRYAVDRTETTMAVWMGLTAGCCVCHDHKYDPITQKDFYSLYAFFNSAADPAMDGNILLTPPILRLTSADQQKQIGLYDRRIAALQARMGAALKAMNYVDPATANPKPPARDEDHVWFEDGFPPGAPVQSQGGHPLTFVERGQGPVLTGARALKRKAAALAQDFYDDKGRMFTVPDGGKFFVHAYLDPDDPPQAIMLQFNSSTWLHRAVWGQVDKIPFGAPNTPEKVAMGPLPRTGEWVRLEVDAEKVGLKRGARVKGYAFTQYGGTVYWDRMGVRSKVDPANDPAWSYQVWLKRNQGRRVEELPQELRDVVRGKKPEEWSQNQARRVKEFWLQNLYEGLPPEAAALKGEMALVQSKKGDIENVVPATFVMKDLDVPRQAYVMMRGQYDKPGDKVARGTPAVFPPLPETENPSRLTLARWLVSPQHPLTARVQVNRLWQQFFGTGLVKTSNDFGSQGEPPSHPELLDWLSVTFREEGWDMKRFVKRLVMSAAYRQASKTTPELLAKDPDNRLLARGPRFRLDAEMVRDQALFVSGLLSPVIGGKGVRPYQPENIWEPVAYSGSNTRFYVQDKGEALYRRSLYTFWKRTAPPPNMTTFDAPSREQSCLRRERSNTPLQALVLMNDVQHVEAARNFAQRILTEGGRTSDQRFSFAWRIVTARFPTAEEVAIAERALQQHLARYRADADAAAQLIGFGESKPRADLNPAELAAWTLVASLLMNLDEALNK